MQQSFIIHTAKYCCLKSSTSRSQQHKSKTHKGYVVSMQAKSAVTASAALERGRFRLQTPV